jgi:transposase
LFPGSDDSEVLEIEVQAYRRVIRRRRYRPLCDCGCAPGIVTAPPPPRLIERGKFGLSVWTSVLLDKFLYGRPSHRLLQDLADHGLNMSAGTLAGGLQALAPLFEPLDQALLGKLRSEAHWHADETRWAVFVELADKVGHRWYLWVFHSSSVVHYVLDASRSATVVEAELAGVQRGVLSCDRYVAYKKFARLHPGVVLAFCWAHQRRDFLELANDYPEVSPWALGWVNAIADLYHLNGCAFGRLR